MPATITGIVFNDLNHNGVFNAGEPGIPNVYVVLYNQTGGTCISMQTDANGNYSFSITTAGTYSVYETVVSSAACPPTAFTQPAGFTMSNGPRKITLAVTGAQISGNVTIAGQNFSHDTTTNSLSCSSTLIQFSGRPSVWYNINVVTGQATVQGTVSPALDINAIGYNPLDNYIYGYDQLNNHIVRVGTNGDVIILAPLPPGLPADGYNVGTFDLNGFLYISINDAARFYVIDLRPDSATFMKLVNPANGYVEQTSNFGVALSTTLNVSDWVFRPSDSNLYGINPTGIVERINPTTGNISNLTTVPHNVGPFGGIAIDSTGTIYALSNNNGAIYRYAITGNTATAVPFSSSLITSFNDATMCPGATIRVDFGDAPDTSAGTGPNNYSTLLENNGPRHELINVLYLGNNVTSETNAYQNANATGDDLSEGIQDDGLTVPLQPLFINAATYTLSVTVTNNSGSPAHLYGWIDYTTNGVFQGNEAAPVLTIPSQPGTQTVVQTYTVPAGVTLTPGQTFVRLRLTTDTLVNQNAAAPTAVDTRSLGPASDGEVEDYVLEIAQELADLAVDKNAMPIPVFAGQPIRFEIKVINFGPNDAQNVVLEDPIPPEIFNPQYSLDGGATFQPWMGNVFLGTVLAGMSFPVIIEGIVSEKANEVIFNMAMIHSTTEDPDLSNNTSTVVVPVENFADLSLVKSASPTPATAGEPLTFTLNIFNAGPSFARDVMLTDAVPSEIIDVQFSIDGGITFQPWPNFYPLGELPPGASQVVYLRGIVDSSFTGVIENTATVQSSTPDPDPFNNSSTSLTPVEPSANISVVKIGSPDLVTSGELLTYTIVVSNAGPSNADNVTLTDLAPSELLNVEFSLDGGITFNPWTGSLSLGTLVSGFTDNVILRGLVSPSATGSIINTATVDSPTPDPDPSDNTSTSETPVNPIADISVTKIGTPNPVPAGNLLTYTLVIANAGPSDAENVTLTDDVPSEILDVVFSTDGGVTFAPWTGFYELGILPNGDAQTILIQGTVNPSETGIIINTAVVSSTTEDPDPTNNIATESTAVNTAADIYVTKSSSPNPVLIGDSLTYTIQIGNLGPNPAQNVTITDAIPSELSSVEFSLDGGVTFAPWTGSTLIGTLVPGDTVTILIRGIVNLSAVDIITNTATVESTTPDPEPANNSSTEITAVNTAANIAIIKTANPTPVVAGDFLTYTLIVSNAGPNTADNVTITDTTPGELLNAEYSLDGGTTFNPWLGSIGIGALSNGASATIFIRGTVNPAVVEDITNTATVDSTTPDPDPSDNTSTVTTPVIPSADISIVKTASPSPATAGGLLTYTLVVSNAGPSDAEDVTVIDAVPSDIADAEFSTDGGVTFNPWINPTVLGTLASGAAVTILLRGTVNSSVTGTITNTAVVASSTPDPDLSNNTSTIITPVNASADLAIFKLGSPDPVMPGQQLTYTIDVSNAGPSDADNVTLTDVAPIALSDVEFSLDEGTTFTPWQGSYNLGTVTNGTVVHVLLRGIVIPSTTGTITNTATITSTTPDPDPTDNTSTDITVVVPSADISIVKTGFPHPVPAGGLLTYTLLVSNDGPSDAANVVVTDDVPSELTGVEFSTNGVVTFQPWLGSYNIGLLASGTSTTLLIRGIVDPTATEITNTAVVSSTTEDPNPTNNESTEITLVQSSADISVTKVANPTPAIAGELLTYTITVSNAGPSEAEAIIVIDAVQSELTDVEFSIDGGISYQPWVDFYNLGTLPSGTSQAIFVRGIVDPSATGSIINSVIVESPTPDPDPTNNTDTIITPVDPSADIAIIKLGSPDPVLSGELLTYTLIVTNAGPSIADNVTVTDVVPSDLINVEFSTDGGVTFTPWPGSYAIGTLLIENVVTLIIRGTVDASVTGTITNTATVNSTTPDPDPTDNTSTNITPVQTLADISVTKIGSPNPVPAGSLLTYTLVVSNAGPSDAENVMLTDAVPSELMEVAYSTDGGITFNPWTGMLDLGTLANGASSPIILRGVVNPSDTGIITNTAVVSSTTEDPDPTNNVATEITAVNTSADLSVTKVSSPNPVLSGNVLTYTIVVSNAGPDTAQNVTLTDTVPSELTGVQFSLDGGVTFNPWLGSINVGTLVNGGSATIVLRGTVDPLATDIITNTATVDSTTPDPEPDNNTATEITAINTSADISIIKTASPSPVLAGNLLTYTLTVSNAGPNPAESIILTDTPPSELTDVEFSADGGITFTPWLGSYSVGTLGNGAAVIVLVRGTVLASATETITNTATVDSTTPDPDPTDNTSTIITPIITSADIAIVKTSSPNPAIAGELLTYSLVISNAGPSDALEVTVVDAAPSELADAEFSLDGGSAFAPWTNAYEIGTVASGASVTLLIRGTLYASVTDSITNTAIVTSPTPDPDPTDNTSTIITPVIPSANISVMKIGSPDPVSPGEWLTYTIEVSNAGPSDADNVILTDIDPSELTSVEFSIDEGVTFNPWLGTTNLGTLPNGNVAIVLLRGVVAPTAAGTITNTASVYATTPDPDPTDNTSTNTIEVLGSADIAVIKSGSPDPVTAGTLLTYTIVVSNAGPTDAENVTLTDTVPSELTNVELSTDDGETFQPWTGEYRIGTLTSLSSQTFLIRGIVVPSATGTMTNTATVISTTPDPDPTNNTSTATTTITPVAASSADISVVKLSSPSPVSVGEVLTYTIVISNAGPSAAENVTLIDEVPSKLRGVEFSTDGGATFNTWPEDYSLGTLASGEVVLVIIRGTVRSTAKGEIRNTATIHSTTPDPDPTNNTSTVVTPVRASSNISIIKSGPSSILTGEILTYSLVVTNAGPSRAENVRVTDTVSTDLTNVMFSLDGGATFAPWLGSYLIGSLANEASVTIMIKGTVRSSAQGSIINTATVSTTTPDPDPSDNTSTIITPIRASADISIRKTASTPNVTAGSTLTYTLVVSNAGPSLAENVILTDVVSNDLTHVTFSLDGGMTSSPWPGTYLIGSLASGAYVTLVIQGTVQSIAAGTITNTAVVSTTTPDPDPVNNTSTVTTPISASADISVVKLANVSPVVIGQLLTYTIVVSNAGPSAAHNVNLTDEIPSGLKHVMYSTDGGESFAPWSGSYSIGTLANGASATIIIRGKLCSSSAGIITNTAMVQTSTPDPNPHNNTSMVSTPTTSCKKLCKLITERKCHKCKERKPHHTCKKRTRCKTCKKRIKSCTCKKVRKVPSLKKKKPCK